MRCRSLLLLLFALVTPAWLAAQAPEPGPQPRTGFWISVALSGGPKWLSCDLCTDDFGNGFGGSVALGGTLNQQWLIGADVVGFFPFAGMDEGYDNHSDGFGAALFTARHYPRLESGLFLMGGLGLGEIDVKQDLLEAKGYVGKVGIGYDLRAGRNFSITPSVSLVQSFGTETERAGDVMEGSTNFGMLQLGVAATWH
jgi:hypothetical protein